MIFNPIKFMAFIFIVLAWILMTFFFIGCANVDKVQEDQGWFPVGMSEDSQGFYNSKYNTLDNGYNDPNINIKVFNTKY